MPDQLRRFWRGGRAVEGSQLNTTKARSAVDVNDLEPKPDERRCLRRGGDTMWNQNPKSRKPRVHCIF